MQALETRPLVLRSENIGTALVPDGYFGKVRRMTLAYDPESMVTIVYDDQACFRSPLPKCVDAREAAFWMLYPHPSVRHFRDIQAI